MATEWGHAARSLLWVFLAGGLGATLRVGLGGFIDARTHHRFAYSGTLAVNMMGCFAIGIAASLMSPGLARTAVIGGLLGGFTTYSAFALFSYDLLRTRQLGGLLAQLGLHLGLGLALVALGAAMGQILLKSRGA